MKNFKLLLATTAILSTTLAANVWAEGEAPAEPTGTGYARIDATAIFTSPIRLTSSSAINFGLLDPEKGGTVTVQPSFTNPNPTGAAVIVGSGSTNQANAGYIELTGGILSSDMDDIEGVISSGATYVSSDPDYPLPLEGQSIAGSYVQLALAGETIALTETGASTGSTASGDLCGTVGTLTQGMPQVVTVSNEQRLQIPLGGTLEIDDDYEPSGNYAICTGHTTVTYVVNNL